MGRGRAKAKQTKVARDLKYRTHETDLSALARELHGGPGSPGSAGSPATSDDVDDEAEVDDADRSEEHTSELQSRQYLVCRLLLEKKKQHNLDTTNRKY